MKKEFEIVKAKVYPSDVNTIRVTDVDNEYGGAHHYIINPMGKYNEEKGEPEYLTGYGEIRFVQKDKESGEFTPGFQTEQILLMLIDRHTKLSKVFSAEIDEEFIGHLQSAVNLLEKRVKDREDRGVMGKLEK